MIEKINQVLKQRFKGQSIELGGIGQFLPTDDGIVRLCYLDDNEENKPFVVDDRFVLQVCHYVVDGRRVGNSDDWVHTVDLVCVAKTQCLPSVMKELLKIREISVTRYNINTSFVIQNYLKTPNDNPDIRAFVIQYSFVDKINMYNCFDGWKIL